ncbi:MAG: hypothetical protein JWP65_3210, partial [Ramlibacter sp.]|nr:hypothetical protein [Ramlibacter sp.]
AASLPPAWRSGVSAAVAAGREALGAVWAQARNAIAEDAVVDLLVPELQRIARQLLARA